MLRRLLATALASAALACAACGGGPRSTTAELAVIRQPTPDPTLDAVVRDLPRALAGVVAPSPTPTAVTMAAVPKPQVKPPVLAATPRAALKPAATPTPPPPSAPQRQPVATPTSARR